ncbi:MAG TPA: hypothetical protein VIX14_15110 [Terriglobales bacterium]
MNPTIRALSKPCRAVDIAFIAPVAVTETKPDVPAATTPVMEWDGQNAARDKGEWLLGLFETSVPPSWSATNLPSRRPNSLSDSRRKPPIIVEMTPPYWHFCQ